MHKCFTFYRFIILCFFLVAHSITHAQDLRLGTIHFKATGAEVAQPYFTKGMLLLHNLDYDEAVQEFEMAQLLDPNFVMAYWGEAMCYNEVFYGRQDLAKGKGVLFKIAVKAPDRQLKAKTPLEKDLLSALELLYGEDQDQAVRLEKHKKSMAELYTKYPAEEEVAAFYALAIISNSISIKENIDLASKILVKLNSINPQHPGALNYLIRLFENPATAYKARKFANDYVLLAPDSRTALSTVAHTFLALGDWEKLVKSCDTSWKLSEAWVKKNKKPLQDRDYHTLWWMQYGYLQQGKYKQALELLETIHLAARYSKSEKIRFHVAMMRGHILMESNKWPENITSIEIPTTGFSTSTKNMCFFIDGMVAIEKADFAREGWFLNQMTDQRMVDKTGNQPFTDFRTRSRTPIIRRDGMEQELILAEVYEWELEAEKAWKSHALAEAEPAIKKAVALEDKTIYQPGPPVINKPANELYGEILFDAGKYTEAVTYFDKALQRAPNRSLSLLGKYRALVKLNQTQKAAEVKDLLMKNWANADEEVRTKLD